jgi:anaerobic magnesium-protoporphyrin IX monomethyl ester cyclase
MATRVLLMHPLRSAGTGNIFYSPDLGLGYLAKALRMRMADRVDVKLLINNLTMGADGFQERLRAGGFDVIGIKVYSTTVDEAKRTIDAIRMAAPEATVVIGGPQPTGDPENILGYVDADFAFQGESEIGFCDFVELYDRGRGAIKGGNVEGIPGLIWRGEKGFIVNPNRVLEDLDGIGMPAWDLMDPREFRFQRDYIFNSGFPSAPFISSRGCPFNCTFCSASKLGYRERSPKNVFDELAYLHREFGVKEFNMYDCSCGFNKRWMIEFCRMVCDSRLDITWNAFGGIKVTSVDGELLSWMKKSRCNQVWLGIESGSQRILDRIRKGITLEQIRTAVDLMNKADIPAVGFFMIGIPGEEKAEIDETIEFSLSLGLSGAVYNIFVPIPGTDEYKELDSRGMLEGLDFNCLDQKYFRNSFSEYSTEELVRLRRRAYWRFHLRPRIVFDRVRLLLRQMKNPAIAYIWVRYIIWHLYLDRRAW